MIEWRPGSELAAGEDSGTGDTPGSGLPRSAEPVRDSPLSGFAKDARGLLPAVSGTSAALEAAACWCPGATRDELLGMLRQWQALESWAAAGKLALLRALIRDDDQPLPGGSYHGDLPDGWTKSLTHEVALALSMPAVSAENQMWLAWNLQAVLPGIGAMLASRTSSTPSRTTRAETLRLQRGRPQSRVPSGQAVTWLDGHPAQARLASVDNPVRPDLHPGTQALPRLSRSEVQFPAGAVLVGGQAEFPADLYSLRPVTP